MRIPFHGMLIACLLAIAPQAAMAKEPVFPELTGPVVDTVDEIPADQEARIDAKIRDYMKKSGHQLQVVTVPDTQDLAITDYGVKLGRHWGIGRAGADDGIILIHALKSSEGRIKIATGKGAEAFLPDGEGGRIMSETIIPAFKNKEFGDGIEQGVDQIIAYASITPEQRAADDARVARENARKAQATRDAFGKILAFGAVLALIGGATWLLWYVATIPKRRRLAEEARIAEEQRRQRLAEQRAERAAERERLEAERIEQEAERAENARLAAIAAAAAAAAAALAEQERKERLAQERKDRLAAMTPADRQAFLDKEAADIAAERERQRIAENQRREKEERDRIRRKEEERVRAEAAAVEAARRAAAEEERRAERRRQDARDEEERQRNASIASATTWGSSSSSSSSSSNDGWSGGGGDFGGGGATGDY